jgi:glutathionyl-hydroquinone reductase
MQNHPGHRQHLESADQCAGRWEDLLSQHDFLCGAMLTEADVRPFTILLRFHNDHSHRHTNPTGIVPRGPNVLQPLAAITI